MFEYVVYDLFYILPNGDYVLLVAIYEPVQLADGLTELALWISPIINNILDTDMTIYIYTYIYYHEMVTACLKV
jgi:hypothetical protein